MAWMVEPERWEKLGAMLQTVGEFALDTETYDQPDRTSPQHRAKVHCWSVAVLTGKRTARGYNAARGFVLPVDALNCQALRDALTNPRVRKWAHNAPHDYHSLSNMGVEPVGLQDTLQWLRVAVPGMLGYGLKAASVWALGKPKRPSFTDVVTYTALLPRESRKKDRRCVCGSRPCRARATSDWFDPALGWWRMHERIEEILVTVVEREVECQYPVTAFVPGAELAPLTWAGQTLDRSAVWEEYSLEDAIDDMELVSWLRARPLRKIHSPWV